MPDGNPAPPAMHDYFTIPSQEDVEQRVRSWRCAVCFKAHRRWLPCSCTPPGSQMIEAIPTPDGVVCQPMVLEEPPTNQRYCPVCLRVHLNLRQRHGVWCVSCELKKIETLVQTQVDAADSGGLATYAGKSIQQPRMRSMLVAT